MRLAWNNILHDRVRFIVTVLGIAFAVFLMVFQGSLLCGFVAAASKLVDTTDSDLWITARGIDCFDFSAPLPKRFLEIASGVPGVAHASRIITSFAEYRTPAGRHQPIALVGADPEVGPEFPVPRVLGSTSAVLPEALIIDQSNADTLSVESTPVEVEVNRHRSRVVREVTGFSSFIGSPYVFTSYSEAAKDLALPPEESMYILLRLLPGADVSRVRAELSRRLPEVDIWTRQEFSKHSQKYWLTQTGAGGGILVAAVLGFLIGLVVVSQTIYATTMEHIEEFATLKALGASRWFVARVVLTQTLCCGALGALVGLAVTVPTIDRVRAAIPWIYMPSWLPVVMFPPTLLMCALAALASIRAALVVEPARVFRA